MFPKKFELKKIVNLKKLYLMNQVNFNDKIYLTHFLNLI